MFVLSGSVALLADLIHNVGDAATAIPLAIAFALRSATAERQAGLARMRKSAKDEPVTLGLLSTSEALAEPALPPGDYVVAYKARGESKKHKENRTGGKKRPKYKHGCVNGHHHFLLLKDGRKPKTS